MKIVKFLGGLGNQMFQYAFYRSMSFKHEDVLADISDFKTYPLHNGFELSKVFSVSVEESSFFQNLMLGSSNSDIVSRAVRKVFGYRETYYEQSRPTFYDPYVFENPENQYLFGYWQNARYFKEVEDIVRTDFKFNPPQDDKNRIIRDKILNTNAVGLHIRRGDYVKHPMLGGICDEEYYLGAIDFFQREFENVQFFIFSNDFEWCKRNIRSKACHYVTWNIGSSSYIDMYLMTLCSHLIISNSSFSWWGAWLNERPGLQVVVPSRWFNDNSHKIGEIVSEKWMKI